MVRHGTANPKIAGSTPVTTFALIFQLDRIVGYEPADASSSLARGVKIYGRSGDMRFMSPTYGDFNTTEDVTKKIVERMNMKPDSEWVIAIGTDSQNKKDRTKFCSAILLLEKGNGGIYFYSTHSDPRLQGVQHRMLKEAETSIHIGHEVIKSLENMYLKEELKDIDYDVKFEIHCDLGVNGKSESSIKAAIGWITAEFGDRVTARIKPDSPAASYVADRYTK